MPTDSLPVYLSTGVSVGLLAGIVSGVCYLITNKYIWNGSDREIANYEDEEAECKTCRQSLRSLRRCQDDDETIDGIPRPIKFREGRWFIKQLRKTMNYIPWSISTEDVNRSGRYGLELRRHSHSGGNVRDVLEHLSSRLAGGTLDSTSVNRLSSHPAYSEMFSRYHKALRDALSSLGLSIHRTTANLPPNPTSTPAPLSQNDERAASTNASGPHARLKKLVARVVEEAMALPALTQYANQRYSPAIDNSTYEDLLATAILNKVITRYQTEGASGSSGVHSASHTPTTPSPTSTPSPSHSADRGRTRLFHIRSEEDEEGRSTESWDESDGEIEESVIVAKRVPFPEFGGDIVHSIDDDNEDESNEEPSGADLQAAEGTWEENWLFQKKKMKSAQSVPVPMLVPNSNTDYKAMIGDKDADDTSDLSELASEEESETEERTGDIKRILIKSKCKIGGKIPTEKLVDLTDGNIEVLNEEPFTEKELFKRDLAEDPKSLNIVLSVDSGPVNKTEFNVNEIHRTTFQEHTDENLSIHPLQDTCSSLSSYRSNQQLDGEYEETESGADQIYARSDQSLQSNNETYSMMEHGNANGTVDSNKTENELTESGLIPGSIADRERKKWLNYVEMPNNPYSAEAIQKRLSNKSSSSLFDMLTSTPNRDDAIVDKEIIKDDLQNHREETSSPSPRVLKDVLGEGATEYKRFGRDYYINEAKRSTGSRKKKLSGSLSLCSIDKTTSYDDLHSNGFTSPVLLIEKFNQLAVVPTNNEKVKDKKDCKKIIEYGEVDERSLFSAKPVQVDDDTEQQFEELVQTIDLESEKSELSDTFEEILTPNKIALTGGEELTSSLSMSSNDDSLKVYSVEKGEIVKCHHTLDKQSTQDKTVRDNKDKTTPKDTVKSESSLNEMDINYNKELGDEIINLPNVKDLAKIFVLQPGSENHNYAKLPQRKAKHAFSSSINDSGCTKQYIHSLTARSISKEFRDELKLSMPNPIKLPGGANEVPEGSDEITREEKISSPLPEPGTLKSKLAFFESLKGNTLQTSNF